MDLKSWVKAEHGRASTLAKSIGIPPSFMSKIIAGKKPVPMGKCMPIERATGGEVTRRDLMPEGYLTHWPELAEKTEAQHEAA